MNTFVTLASKDCSKVGVCSWRSKVVRALALGVTLPLCACQWMTELGTPGGSIQFNELQPEKAVAAYNDITQDLLQLGFQEIEPGSPESAAPLNTLFEGKRSGYFKDYVSNERNNPLMISLQIDMNADHTAVNYQVGEYERIGENRMKPRLTREMSAEGCKVVTTINRYIVDQLGQSHLIYNGMPKC